MPISIIRPLVVPPAHKAGSIFRKIAAVTRNASTPSRKATGNKNALEQRGNEDEYRGQAKADPDDLVGVVVHRDTSLSVLRPTTIQPTPRLSTPVNPVLSLFYPPPNNRATARSTAWPSGEVRSHLRSSRRAMVTLKRSAYSARMRVSSRAAAVATFAPASASVA